ncbi:hypothetical protein [Pedobacter nutrimenti]|jgi:hypothetical protein|uniref:TolA protein n=1 Tax=Pedobacter nutrimenti TaxID=1241337 RepID=A0A318UDY1_9SPHI|nr:hypothetical protein [Pedobacter nutrimenti]PYF72706.1 hypothetical protein B0O44_10575 [Pedobacter nutrimenti]
MKTNPLKNTLLLTAMMAFSVTVIAQEKPTNTVTRHESYTSTTKNGSHEQIITDWKGKRYQIELVNDQLTSFYIDGEKIASNKWDQYSSEIKEIREQIQKNRIQAEKDREQARKDRAQARMDREQAQKDREQAQKDREQALKDRQQALRDRDQALKDRDQAIKDQQSAREDKKKTDDIINELVKDGIIPNEKALRRLTITNDQISVNGKKLSAEVLKKYQEKFNLVSDGHKSQTYMITRDK